MLSRLRQSGIVRGVSALSSGLVDSFLRGNRVLPPVLAVLGLLIFAWIAAGLFLGDPKEERVANQANVVVQSRDEVAQADSQSPAPEAESRDVESYAAYQSKDPFRQLFSAADTGNAGGETTTDNGSGNDNSGGSGSGGNGSGEETTNGTTGDGNGSGGANDSGRGGGTSRGAQDSDNDGLSDRRERSLGTDPNNPDTDADGVRDGADDSNGDGIPDGKRGGGGASQNGRGNNSGGGGGNGDLFDSGGNLP